MINVSLYTPSLIERFWAKVDKNGPIPEYRPDLGPCWIWTAARTKHGYGQIGSGGKRGKILYAHRVSYELHVGELPKDRSHHLDHLCRVTSCVNPAHLEYVTCSENVLRGVLPERLRQRYAAMTHCVNDHEWTPENTYFRPGTTLRCCRTCNVQRQQAYEARKVAQAAQ